jgi:hypothetical protein
MNKAKILMVEDHDFDLYPCLKISSQADHNDPADARDDTIASHREGRRDGLIVRERAVDQTGPTIHSGVSESYGDAKR